MRLKGIQILVAEDEPIAAKLLKHLLEHEGARVDIVSDGAEAFRQGTRGDYHVIVMDLNMPEVNGVEAIRSLKLVLPERKIIVLSAYGAGETFDEARAAGAAICLEKPVSPEELFEQIVTLVT